MDLASKSFDAFVYGGRYHGFTLRDWPHSHFASEVISNWNPTHDDPFRMTRQSVRQVWQKWLVTAEVFSPLMAGLLWVEDVIFVLDPLTPAAYKDEWLFDCFGVLRVEDDGKLTTLRDVDWLLFMRGRRGNVDGPIPSPVLPSSHRWVLSERIADVRDRDHERLPYSYWRRPRIGFRPLYDRLPELPTEDPAKDGATT